MRKAKNERILVLLNFSDTICENYVVEIENIKKATPLLDSDWDCFDGSSVKNDEKVKADNGKMIFDLQPFSAKYYILK